MTFEETVDQAIEMVRRRGQISYRMLKRQFDLDDDTLEDLKDELIEAERVTMHFELIYERLLAFVDEFYRIFDRKNVIGFVVVDVIDHRRQRRRLAGTGRPGNENDATRMHR